MDLPAQSGKKITPRQGFLKRKQKYYLERFGWCLTFSSLYTLVKILAQLEKVRNSYILGIC